MLLMVGNWWQHVCLPGWRQGSSGIRNEAKTNVLVTVRVFEGSWLRKDPHPATDEGLLVLEGLKAHLPHSHCPHIFPADSSCLHTQMCLGFIVKNRDKQLQNKLHEIRFITVSPMPYPYWSQYFLTGVKLIESRLKSAVKTSRPGRILALQRHCLALEGKKSGSKTFVAKQSRDIWLTSSLSVRAAKFTCMSRAQTLESISIL